MEPRTCWRAAAIRARVRRGRTSVRVRSSRPSMTARVSRSGGWPAVERRLSAKVRVSQERLFDIHARPPPGRDRSRRFRRPATLEYRKGAPARSGAAGQRAARARRALALRLDDDRDLGRHPREDLDRDLVGPERLERLVELDLVSVDVDAAARQRVGDVLRRDRAVELAALTDLDAHREGRARDARRCDLGFLALALPFVLATRDVVLPCTVRAAGGGHGERVWDEEVGRIAVGDLLHLPALAQLGHVLREDDLHALRSSLLIQALVRGPRPSVLMASLTPPMNSGTRRMVRRTGPGVKRRTWAMSLSNSTRSMPSSASFSSSRSSGTPSRKNSAARTMTTRSSSPPMIGMSSGIRSHPTTR